jgi:hypothetical protein
MTINTKYDVREKVYYYIPEINKYAWGVVERIQADVNSYKRLEVTYTVTNRFYKPRDYHMPYVHLLSSETPYFQIPYYCFNKDQIFKTVEDVFNSVIDKQKAQRAELKELKKGFFE